MTTPADDPMLVFDRAALRRRRARAAWNWDAASFLKREIAERLVERLDDIRRAFPLAVDLGCHGGEVAAALRDTDAPPRDAGASPRDVGAPPRDTGASPRADGRRRGGVETLVSVDLSLPFARRAAAFGPALVADEELPPFAPASVDLVVSAMALHWVNDLPGALAHVARALRPDGLFLAAMLGGGTLLELRRALAQAESDIDGGLSPRVSPFADLRDAAGLLQRAGFAMPVADSETIEVRYADTLALMRDLKAMGESNAVRGRRGGLGGRAVLARAAALHDLEHRGADGRVPARFEVLFLHGWAPHASQPRPLRPGAATSRLADALGAVERSAGEKPGG